MKSHASHVRNTHRDSLGSSNGSPSAKLFLSRNRDIERERERERERSLSLEAYEYLQEHLVFRTPREPWNVPSDESPSKSPLLMPLINSSRLDESLSVEREKEKKEKEKEIVEEEQKDPLESPDMSVGKERRAEDATQSEKESESDRGLAVRETERESARSPLADTVSLSALSLSEDAHDVPSQSAAEALRDARGESENERETSLSQSLPHTLSSESGLSLSLSRRVPSLHVDVDAEPLSELPLTTSQGSAEDATQLAHTTGENERDSAETTQPAFTTHSAAQRTPPRANPAHSLSSPSHNPLSPRRPHTEIALSLTTIPHSPLSAASQHAQTHNYTHTERDGDGEGEGEPHADRSLDSSLSSMGHICHNYQNCDPRITAHLVVNSLVLLGFNGDDYIDIYSGIAYDLPILTEDAFAKSNQKLLLIVLHYLLSLLVRDEFLHAIAKCWPFLDTREKNAYLRAVHRCLRNIIDVEDNIDYHASILTEAKGRRVWLLLRFLTDKCLQMMIHSCSAAGGDADYEEEDFYLEAYQNKFLVPEKIHSPSETQTEPDAKIETQSSAADAVLSVEKSGTTADDVALGEGEIEEQPERHEEDEGKAKIPFVTCEGDGLAEKDSISPQKQEEKEEKEENEETKRQRDASTAEQEEPVPQRETERERKSGRVPSRSLMEIETLLREGIVADIDAQVDELCALVLDQQDEQAECSRFLQELEERLKAAQREIDVAEGRLQEMHLSDEHRLLSAQSDLKRTKTIARIFEQREKLMRFLESPLLANVTKFLEEDATIAAANAAAAAAEGGGTACASSDSSGRSADNPNPGTVAAPSAAPFKANKSVSDKELTEKAKERMQKILNPTRRAVMTHEEMEKYKANMRNAITLLIDKIDQVVEVL